MAFCFGCIHAGQRSRVLRCNAYCSAFVYEIQCRLELGWSGILCQDDNFRVFFGLLIAAVYSKGKSWKQQSEKARHQKQAKSYLFHHSFSL